jgi:hypothetical protein
MEAKQNPFSLYDFLGYFTPGAILLYASLYLAKTIWPDTPTFHDAAARIGLDRAEAYLPFVLIAYAIGHISSFVSSVSIERYSLWAMGYPSKYLLGVDHKGYFHSDKHFRLRAVVRSAIFLLILPISALDLLLGKILGMRDLYAKPLDQLLITVIRQKVDHLLMTKGGIADLSAHGKAGDLDFFRFAYHYSVENAQHHLPKMQNYVALFGFLRNISLISVLAFWLTLYAVSKSLIPWQALPALAIASYLYFMAFVKFYRRFCLEALMATAVVVD